MRTHALLLGILLAGSSSCSAPRVEPYTSGPDAFFDFDGELDWEFVSTDEELPYHLIATLDTQPEEAENGARIYAIGRETRCVPTHRGCGDGVDLGSYRMSADVPQGALFWGYRDPELGSFDFTPPIQITVGYFRVGDALTTEVLRHATGSAPASGEPLTFTSTVEAVERCPVEWTDTWDGCVRIEVAEAGDAYPSATWWIFLHYGIVAWTSAPEEQSHQWRLLVAHWSPLEE